MDTSGVFADAEDRVVDEAVAALAGRDRTQQHDQAGKPQHGRDMRQLFWLFMRCVRAGRPEPIIKPAQQIAAFSFAAGVDLDEVQGEFGALADALGRHVGGAPAGEQRDEAIGLVNAIVGAGKDALARTYAALAGLSGSHTDDHGAAVDAKAGAPRARPGCDAIRTDRIGLVGVITLDDRRKHNAICASLADGMLAALKDLRARDARVIVLRAADGMSVWSSGHDIDELPRGRRDPLGYNDPLEEMLRAVRSFPAPVIAMVHGTVWGGALDLVLSCDLVVADETAAFAITPANLGLPYNITGLLHFVGRLPINLIKEMFFTAAPVNARKAKEWLIINHLVAADQLESFTMALAATMATKSPLAIAVIKEQLNALSDYHPIAAQVYDRIQGLRRQAYDSGDYLEGLDAFAQKRQPIFRGT